MYSFSASESPVFGTPVPRISLLWGRRPASRDGVRMSQHASGLRAGTPRVGYTRVPLSVPAADLPSAACAS